MNTFSKKSLHVALAGLGALGLANTAGAVMVNPNGLGEVLIYPYYTVRNSGAGNAYNTLLSIVNTTASTKAVKVRFREGKASKEVLDFNVFLSPSDVWTAAVTPDGAGGAQITTQDKSCTIPSFTPGSPVAFRTGAFTSDVLDGGADRLTEGYFEVFEMATYVATDPVAVGSKHTATTPANCAVVTDAAAAADPRPAAGGLMGSELLINVKDGVEFSQNATALTQFWDPTRGAGSTYSTTGDTTPNYGNGGPVASAVNGAGQIITGLFADGALATTAALQRTSVDNEFVLETGTLSGTDWVVTMPTKHLLVSEGGAIAPFTQALTASGACDAASLTTFDREETAITPAGPDFSPSPTPQGFSLCWEANVISFTLKDASPASPTVLGSANATTVKTPFANGWASLTFPTESQVALDVTGYDPQNGLTFTPSATFSGLPVVGFAAQTYTNGTLTTTSGGLLQSNYGAAFSHRYVGPQAAGVVTVGP
jgi:hypothetical protein